MAGSRAPKFNPMRPIARRHLLSEPGRQARRALATNSATWRRLRASVLAAEPLCRECGKKGRVRAASCVDHVDGNAMNNDPNNLQPLCSPCHSRKTAREDGGFGNRTARAKGRGESNL